MKYIVVDTCIVMHVIRGKAKGQQANEYLYNHPDNPTLVVSVVTKAELLSLAIQLKWGADKRQLVEDFLKSVTIVDINNTDDDLMTAYADIDAYSKGKGVDKNGNLKTGSANMIGKNDLWIAATAKVLDATLLTSDGDFDHLTGVFLTIEKQ